jgi:N-acyl-D-amino-acid deacylase
VTDTATYENPRQAAVGIDDVFVAGVPVLAGGELTGEQPGRGLRRARGTR